MSEIYNIWEQLYNELGTYRERVISALEDDEGSAHGELWRLCHSTAEIVGGNHPNIRAGRQTPNERRFYVKGITEDAILVSYHDWNNRENMRITHDIEINITIDLFFKTMKFFRRDAIQFGREKGVVPDGKYNIYDKTGEASRNPFLVVRNLLPMLSLGIIELGGKNWLEHTDKENIRVGDSMDNYISFSGPGTVRNPASIPPENIDENQDALKIYKLLKLRQNVILEGVPGIGKTWIRDKVAAQLDAEMEVVTFHPASTYEEFVGGIFPKSEDGIDTLLFEYQEGVLTRFADTAMGKPGRNYILFIDEINRANIPLVIGELLTIIESTKRTRPGSGKIALNNGPTNEGDSPWEVAVHVETDDTKSKYLRLPSNLYILATMNTSDRSVVSMDAALRRRSAYYRIETKLTEKGQEEMWAALKDYWWGDKKDTFDTVFSVLAKINQLLKTEIGPDAMLGHSYLFFSEDEVDGLNNVNEVVSEMMELNILPQIADILTSMNKTDQNSVDSINKLLSKIPTPMFRHELKAPTSGGKSLDIAVTVCERIKASKTIVVNLSEYDDDKIFVLDNDKAGPKMGGISGYMVEKDSKFIVLEGSGSISPEFHIKREEGNIKADTIELLKKMSKKRKELIFEGDIKEMNEDYGIFQNNVTFDSINAAASGVRGTTVTASRAWKRKSDGQSYENT